MIGKSFRLFRLFGFTVSVDASWTFIAILVTWSLAVGFFPQQYPDLSGTVYWVMGILGAIGLFVSIIFHEFWHSLVARRYGLPMKGITLFIFGGVSEMSEEPRNPKTEFLMAVAGPVSSIVLGGAFYLIYVLGEWSGWPILAGGLVGYLAFINWVLAGFNLVPAFPLDGGRMLRSALWHWKGDLRWATDKAAKFGSGFGFVLMALGALSLLTGNFVGGLWYFIIGLFLHNAAQMTYRQVLLRDTLAGEKVSDLMRKDPVAVPPSLSIQDLVEDYIYRYHFKTFPVVEEGRLVGCVSTRQVKEIPREEWRVRTVAEASTVCSTDNTIPAGDEASKALAIMGRSGNSRLLVVDGDRLVGIIALKDILSTFSLRREMEGEV